MRDPADHNEERRMIESARREAEGLVAQNAPTLPPSDSIAGFDIINEVGRGGMGVVYKAVQISTNRIVALKVILAGPFASSSVRRRFQREVELAARFQHPGIVRVLEGGESAAGQLYYAMDFIDGVQLNRWLTLAHPDVPAIIGLFVRLGEAVEYAHQHKVIHRDLKPANVLVDTEKHPRILDFGLSKALDDTPAPESLTISLADANHIMGTLPYMSPEQAAGHAEEVDAQSDVYALGVMLFEALNGSLPIDARGSLSQIVERICEGPPVSPSSFSAGIDRDLQQITLKALDKDKTQRYSSAAEFSADLDRYLHDEPVLARPASSFYRVRRRLSKYRKRVAVMAAALIALLLISSGRAWWRNHRLEQQTANRLIAAREAVMEADFTLQIGLDGALPIVRQRTAKYGWLPEARLVGARAEHQAGFTFAALSPLEAIIAQDRTPWAARSLLAEIFHDQGREDLAADSEVKAEQEMPQTAEAWYLQSFATFDSHEAAHCARRATEFDPTHSSAWVRRFYLHYLNQDFGEALRCADRLIELHPIRLQYILFRGHVLMALGRFEDAVEQYAEIVRIYPDDHNGYRFRASAYRGAGEYERSVVDFATAHDIRYERQHPSSTWLLFHQVTPLWILGRLEEAAETSQRAYERMLVPSYNDVRHFLILRQLGHEERARAVLRRALTGRPDPWLRKILECIEGQIAPPDLVEAADNAEHRCESYYYAGEASLLYGEPSEAIEWFRKCLDTRMWIDPNTWPPDPMNEYELARWRLESLGEETFQGEIEDEITDDSSASPSSQNTAVIP